MSDRTHTVRFFQADCRDCLHGFGIPLLGDFACGEIILHGERGTVFAIASAIEEPAWEEIESALASKLGSKSKPDYAKIARFQRVVAACADKTGGQTFGLSPVCPACRSHSIIYGDSKPLSIQEVPFATFADFMSKPKPQRQQIVLDLWNTVEKSGDIE